MILSVCVQAGQRKLPDRFAKFFLGVFLFKMFTYILLPKQGIKYKE